MLHDIPHQDISNDFWMAYQYARHYLNSKMNAPAVWLRNHLNQPFIEHMAFAFGSQVYFIFVRTEGAQVNENYVNRFLERCEDCNAIPCFMTMLPNNDGTYSPKYEGWNLRLISSQDVTIDPSYLWDDKKVPMTDWELYDFAVDTVYKYIKENNGIPEEQITRHSNIGIDPQIWFEQGPRKYYVVVRQTLYPEMSVERPPNSVEMATQLLEHGATGYFASVSLACVDTFDDDGEEKEIVAPYRGCGCYVNFTGLEFLVN